MIFKTDGGRVTRHRWVRPPLASANLGEESFLMRSLFALVSGMVLGAVVLVLGVYWYFATGRAPVATSAPPMPFEKQLAHQALNARVEHEMPRTVPLQADEPNLAAGAQTYREHCAVCHGLPGQKETAIAKGMYPHPPKLTEGKGVTDDEP